MQSKNDVTRAILADFESKKQRFEGYRNLCHGLIEELLRLKNLRVHSVTSRVKEMSSLRGKLERSDKHYEDLDEVTDIVRIRIISHFEDDVDRIGAVIEDEFDVDQQESIDKRKLLDPDRFGYLSLHYVCSLSKNRLILPECSQFAGLKCEVQIRSILQHTWAEIEHDLGYKAGSTVPAPVRRRFSRLAGLLEIADGEFRGIRAELSEYKSRVVEEIATSPSSVEIDDISLRAIIESDEIVKKLSLAMAEFVDTTLKSMSPEDLQKLANHLHYIGIHTIEDLRGALVPRQKLIYDQWCIRMRNRRASGQLWNGIAVYHLFQVVLAEGGDLQRVMDGLADRNISVGSHRLEAAREILDAVNSSKTGNS